MFQRWKDRLISAAVTGAMIVSMAPAPAFADPANTNKAGDPAAASVLDTTATTATPAGPGHKLTVTGLEAGDTVTYYRIIEQDVDDTTTTPVTVGTQKWKLSKIVDSDGDGIVDGTENTDFGHKDLSNNTVNGLYVNEMVIGSYEMDAEGKNVTSDTRKFTPAMVNAIANAVTNNLRNNVTLPTGTTGTSTVAAGSNVFEVAGAPSGLYMFVAVPTNGANGGEPDYIYKPIFVAADYYNTISVPEDNTHQIALETGTPTTYADYVTEPNKGVFKKSPLSIDKQAGQKDGNGNYTDLQTDVAVGDTIDFSITVPVPTYTKNYVAPQFYVTDTLTKGLALDATSIKVAVKNGDTAVTVNENKDYKVFTEGSDLKKFNGMTENTEGFVVQFLNDNPDVQGHQDGFLYTVVGAPTATITYSATVTTLEGATFAQQINQMDNTAKLIYSRDSSFIPFGYYEVQTGTDPSTGAPTTEYVPSDSFSPDDPGNKVKPDPADSTKPGTEKEPTGELQDKTRHYTFDIDADVLGRDQSGDLKPGEGGQPGTEPLPDSEHNKTSELRKVWIDADGNEIVQEKPTSLISKNGDSGSEGAEYSGKDGVYGWLEGAEFSLKQTKTHTVTAAGTGTFTELNTPVDIKFDGTTHVRVATGGVNPTSDARGYIPMKGLDAGEYELTEVRAPLGYAFNPNIKYTITITPTYVMEPKTPTEGTTPEDGKGGADDLILSSYEVRIKTKKLDANLNATDEDVESICIYNLKQDANNSPISLLKDDGTSNVEPTVSGDPATVTPAAAGIDTTVTAFANNEGALIYNQKLGILPATGGSGILFYLFVGGAVAGIALVAMNRLKKAATAA